MPKLPSDIDLGAAPAPRPAGLPPSTNVSGDYTAVAKATARLGETVQNVGDAIYQIDKVQTKARQASQLTDAVGKATGELGELELSFHNDQDFKTSPTRYQQGSDLIRQKHEQAIDDPVVRDAFGIRFRNLSQAKLLNVKTNAFKQEADYNIAALDRNADVYAATAATAANSAERDFIVDQYRIDLSNMKMRNWITDVDAGKREREFLGKVDQAIVTRDMARDPFGTAMKLAEGIKPTVQQASGSISTEKTISFEQGGQHYVIPTIVNGVSYTPKAAMRMFDQGKNPALGQFETGEEARMFAEQRSKNLDRAHGGPGALHKGASDPASGRLVDEPGARRVVEQYAPNLDPLMRERLIDQGYRRGDEQQRHRDAAAERERKRIGEDMLKEAMTRQDAGTLDRSYVDRVRPFVEPHEYRSLLQGLAGVDRKDDPTTFAYVEGLVETDPAEARRQAFIQHGNGRLSNGTLQSINTRTRSIERQEGPRSPYERERQYITNAIRPSDVVPDAAASARYAIVIREYDDYAGKGTRSDVDLRNKADELLKRWTMVDMTELARKSSAGARPSPQEQIDANLAEASRLMADLKARKVSEADFKKKMDRLEKSTKAAEKALANGAGK